MFKGYGFKKVKISEEEKIPNSTWLYKGLVHDIKVVGFINEMVGSKGNIQIGVSRCACCAREDGMTVEIQKGNRYDNMLMGEAEIYPFLQLIEDITGEEYLLSRKLSGNGRKVYKRSGKPLKFNLD
jgi:hypothetical protein